ncbi:uncharacterized protein [Gorilla gorilla gorilla]|uniref:uncharacterized protein n=1 Tax=Gorilla gorilla gorilla TaxID=9595 RepID=UPI00300A6997
MYHPVIFCTRLVTLKIFFHCKTKGHSSEDVSYILIFKCCLEEEGMPWFKRYGQETEILGRKGQFPGKASPSSLDTCCLKRKQAFLCSCSKSCLLARHTPYPAPI